MSTAREILAQADAVARELEDMNKLALFMEAYPDDQPWRIEYVGELPQGSSVRVHSIPHYAMGAFRVALREAMKTKERQIAALEARVQVKP